MIDTKRVICKICKDEKSVFDFKIFKTGGVSVSCKECRAKTAEIRWMMAAKRGVNTARIF